MKPLYFILFLVTLPLFISLGHDLYLFYMAQDQNLSTDLITKIYTEERPGRSFDFAAFGYIWTQYSPESYKLMADSYTPEEWARIQEFLKIKATLFFGALAVLAYGVALLLKLISVIKESGTRVSRNKKAKMHQR